MIRMIEAHPRGGGVHHASDTPMIASLAGSHGPDPHRAMILLDCLAKGTCEFFLCCHAFPCSSFLLCCVSHSVSLFQWNRLPEGTNGRSLHTMRSTRPTVNERRRYRSHQLLLPVYLLPSDTTARKRASKASSRQALSEQCNCSGIAFLEQNHVMSSPMWRRSTTGTLQLQRR